MELISLRLQNFRQFKDATIDFSIEEGKSVTVIHGPNGSGKTTLLNAFPWILYGAIGFENGIEHLPNEGVVAQTAVGNRIRVEGTLSFTHDGTEFRATRWVELRKEKEGDLHGVFEDQGISLAEEQANGEMREVKNPDTRLKQILPDRLRSLFFFDGEDIDELAGVDNQDRVQEAIQNIMGLTILERSIRHLRTVESEYESQMEEFGSDELKKLLAEKHELEADIRDRKREISAKREAKITLEGEIGDIKAQLEELEESAELEEDRSELEAQRAEIEEQIEKINANIREEISESAYLEFGMPAIRATAEAIDELRAKGDIPSELSNEFVDRLLNKGECICDRPLEAGTDPYTAVEGWKSELKIEGLDQAAIHLISQLEHIAVGRSKLFEKIDTLVAERETLEGQVTELTEKIDEVSTKLEGLDETSDKNRESPAELERTRKEKVKQLEDTKEQIIRLDQRLQDDEEKIEDLEADIEAEEEEKGKALTAKRRRAAAVAVREELEANFVDLQSTVRGWSDRLVKETFAEISHKDLEADISEDFKLLIRQKVDGALAPVDKSTGERQIASLAFIGSLVSIARERYETSDDSPYFKGGIYPVVMDSPFGSLDKTHQKQVGRLMPHLAEQVIVFATDSQWDGAVAEEMQPFVGKQYWLNYDRGQGEKNYPQTHIESQQTAVAGGE
ncbi:AAA family ATPase [Haladaptatus sp. ZSTT2]|uniref:AAA family ATPase n=1 Tax=Haladaptatus sp. ZSTT2 TaxID=3120515 RepID=UPI00300E7428